MWMSKPVYEGVPYYYMALGLAALLGAFWAHSWYWPEICAAVGVAGLIAGLVIWLKRRGYRTSRSRLDFEEMK